MPRLSKNRKKLIESGYDKDSVVAMTTDDVKKELVKINAMNTNTEKKEVVASDDNNKTKTKPEKCNYGDPGWSAWVVSHFVDDELEGVNPRLEGLRRVTNLLIGRVLEETTNIVCPPTTDNGMVACATCSIVIKPHSAYDQHTMRFDGAADACHSNCVGEFSNYLTAMAETRAKGRAYRSALGLNRVISAEEVFGSVSAENVDVGMIKTGQISIIRIMADRVGVSITKMLKHLDIDKTRLEDLTYTEGLLVVKNLNNIQNMDKIPESLRKTL